MVISIYNEVVNIVGVLPIQLEWVYGLCTAFLLVSICLIILMPFVWLSKR